MAAKRKLLKKRDTSFTTWKLRLENTVNADPKLGPACLKIVRAYLDWTADQKARPFLSIVHLRVVTALSEPTIIKARRQLESAGYFVPDGKTSSGAQRYRLVNAGENRVLDHMTITRETLLRFEAEKKDRERQKRQSKMEAVANDSILPTDSPKESLGHLSPEETLGQEAYIPPRFFRDSPKESLGNYVEYSVEEDISEEEGIVRERIYTHGNNNPYGQVDNDAVIPFTPPTTEEEADDILSCAGNVHPLIMKQLRRMLMAGELTPALLLSDGLRMKA